MLCIKTCSLKVWVRRGRDTHKQAFTEQRDWGCDSGALSFEEEWKGWNQLADFVPARARYKTDEQRWGFFKIYQCSVSDFVREIAHSFTLIKFTLQLITLSEHRDREVFDLHLNWPQITLTPECVLQKWSRDVCLSEDSLQSHWTWSLLQPII